MKRKTLEDFKPGSIVKLACGSTIELIRIGAAGALVRYCSDMDRQVEFTDSDGNTKTFTARGRRILISRKAELL